MATNQRSEGRISEHDEISAAVLRLAGSITAVSNCSRPALARAGPRQRPRHPHPDRAAHLRPGQNRAAQTLSMFGMVLIISVLIAIPGQAYRTLGAELVVLAVIAGTGLHVLDRRAKGESSNQAIGPVLEAVTPITVTSLLLLAAGTVLVLGVRAGLYVLVGPVFVALAGGVTSAWLFLTKITE